MCFKQSFADLTVSSVGSEPNDTVLFVVPGFLLGSLMMLFRLFSIELSETVRLFLLSTFWKLLPSERDCGLLLSDSITEGETVEPFETVPALSEAVEQTSSISSDHCVETS